MNNLIITVNNTFLTILKLVSKSITNNSGLETKQAINVEKRSKSANYIFNYFIQIEIRSLSRKVNDVISQHALQPSPCSSNWISVLHQLTSAVVHEVGTFMFVNSNTILMHCRNFD